MVPSYLCASDEREEKGEILAGDEHNQKTTQNWAFSGDHAHRHFKQESWKNKTYQTDFLSIFSHFFDFIVKFLF